MFSPARLSSIRNSAQRFSALTDAELKEQSLKLKYVAMRGRLCSKSNIAFGLVTEAVRRHLGKTYYDVQLQGGIAMAKGAICEMKTGEGKTLTAALPSFYFSLAGLGCHVVTVNDYLAQRDHQNLQPVYQALGLSCGVILDGQSPEERAVLYRRDITYGTAKEFGFDFLRDRMSGLDPKSKSRSVQRELHSVIVDEADSILLDEARTPLIIGTVDPSEAARSADCFTWAAECAKQFIEHQHFNYDEEQREVRLTSAGFQQMGQLDQNTQTRGISNLELKQHIERAIQVQRNYYLDKHYAICDGQIVIIDEFTGRPAEGRQWQAGIHQSIEAKEQLRISPKTESAASVTMQHFFRLYTHMCGMTGTAMSSKAEFRKVYECKVVAVPTNRPVRRSNLLPRVFVDTTSKFEAVVAETQTTVRAGRAVLIGTRSVEKSELLSQMLRDIRLAHNTLNARYLTAEAEIIAAAGQPGAVTVATNMAGRGTDILLHDDVRAAGGLHVILTEIHESQRIDLQLIGRCSRQGDPGSQRIYVSLDDEILKLGLGELPAMKLQKRFAAQASSQGELPARLFRRFKAAQAKTQRNHRTDRMALLHREKQLVERMFETGQDIYLETLR